MLLVASHLLLFRLAPAILCMCRYVSMCYILHTNYHALINELISHIVPYIHQIIAYSLVSGSMKRLVAYFSVRIVRTRWTHILYPNSRLLTLLRDQNFPRWRTRFKFPAGATTFSSFLLDYELPTYAQRELFFEKSQTFGLGQTNWAEILLGIWVFFGQTICTILALWVSCLWENVLYWFGFQA